MAAAVVNEPAGSGKTEISNGGTIEFLPYPSYQAQAKRLPHIKSVFFALFTDLENIASCTRPFTSVRFTLV